ncbi:MAG: hypothetical protein AAF998_20100 [Bacteroidota bacterium]
MSFFRNIVFSSEVAVEPSLVEQVGTVIAQVAGERTVRSDVTMPTASLSGSSQIDFVFEDNGSTTYIETAQMGHPRVGDYADLLDLMHARQSQDNGDNSRYVLVSTDPKIGEHIPSMLNNELAHSITVLTVDELADFL